MFVSLLDCFPISSRSSAIANLDIRGSILDLKNEAGEKSQVRPAASADKLVVKIVAEATFRGASTMIYYLTKAMLQYEIHFTVKIQRNKIGSFSVRVFFCNWSLYLQPKVLPNV